MRSIDAPIHSDPVMSHPVMADAAKPDSQSARRRLTRRCSEPSHHKVLGRGRVSTAPLRAPSARVLKRTRAVAELGS